MLLRARLLACVTAAAAMSVSVPASGPIDTAIHVWGSAATAAAFPWAEGGEPPAEIDASPDVFRARAAATGTAGALIVQPINYKFDHAFVAAAIAGSGGFYKGMALADPSQVPAAAVASLRALRKAGFCSVRFNPYLEDGWLAGPTAAALFGEAGVLGMPVGVMCFKGLSLHATDIAALCASSPETAVVLDHGAFVKDDDAAGFELLLSLLRDHPSIYVKLSAFFRCTSEEAPGPALARRIEDLRDAVGASRLMYGSDFPYVETAGQPAEGYAAGLEFVSTGVRWETGELDQVLRGTAEAVFGRWGVDEGSEL